MKPYGLLHRFMQAALSDCRLNKSHIAVYLAIFHVWAEEAFPDVLFVYSRDIMPLAKISSRWTYHRVIRELSAYGYIAYQSSFHPARRSSMRLMQLIDH